MSIARKSSSPYRASLLFIFGLGLAVSLSVLTDNASIVAYRSGTGLISTDPRPGLSPLPPRSLTPADSEAARVAWAYFAANTDAGTGLVSNVAGFPSTTLWDQGSYILGLVAARRLRLVDQAEFDGRAAKILDSLGRMPLFEDRLPNKVYDTRDLTMVNYANEPVAEGIGWSAIDIARMLIALRVLLSEAPDLSHDIDATLARWDLQAMTSNGSLIGSLRERGETLYLQEGRLGYEQYAARAAALWGLDVSSALSAARVIDWTSVEGVRVPIDLRRRSSFGAIAVTASEPYMLQGLEMGLNSEFQHMAAQVYLAQEARAKTTGSPTMVSEDHIDREPNFLYGSVHGDGIDWAVLSEDGAHHPELRTVSTKAVFAWDALYNTEYTKGLRANASPALSDPVSGWAAGWYTATNTPNTIRTLNTNAVILEAIHYISNGPLL